MTTVALALSLASLAGLTVMQLLLLAGVPIGEYAWGGKHRILPARLRLAAVAAVILYSLFATLLLVRAKVFGEGDSPLIVVAVWVLFAYAALSILPNVASKSRKERSVQTAVSAVLATGIGFVAALGGA